MFCNNRPLTGYDIQPISNSSSCGDLGCTVLEGHSSIASFFKQDIS